MIPGDLQCGKISRPSGITASRINSWFRSDQLLIAFCSWTTQTLYSRSVSFQPGLLLGTGVGVVTYDGLIPHPGAK